LFFHDFSSLFMGYGFKDEVNQVFPIFPDGIATILKP
jgi:hypothetical protein